MYVYTYFIVLAMKNESSTVNGKTIQILYYCLTLQCMIQLFIYISQNC